MHYLIFIPNKSGPSRSNLRDAGLGDLLRVGDDLPAWADLDGRGPGGQTGQIWTWNESPVYLPEQQTWTADKRGRYWFGINTAKPPRAVELLRRNPVAGLMQTMADGSEWQIPNVLNLPAVFDIDENDEPIKVPSKPYKPFADDCAWALEAVINAVGHGVEPDWVRVFKFAVDALSVNYRVNRQIVAWLGLLDDTLIHTIAAKATDADRIRQVLDDLKKKGTVSPQDG